MSDLQVRCMTKSDVEAVMDLAASLDSAPHWPRTSYETALDPAAVPSRIALVAGISGEVIGFTIASLIPPQAELETIAVSRSHQRCHAGSALLQVLCRELAGRQITEITLEVRASNLPAQSFYRHHGLVEHARRKGYYADTGEGAILMRGLTSSCLKIK